MIVTNTLFVSLAIPYFPPAQTFITLEDSVKKVPEYAYQLYLADEASAKEVENNVSRARHIYT